MSANPQPRVRPAPAAPPRVAPPVSRRAPTARYSRFVGLMRVLLPALAVALLGLLLAWPRLGGREDVLDLALADLKERAAGMSTMVNPRYFGTDSGNRPYVITAELARPVDRESTLVALDAPKASLELNGGIEVSLAADSGLFRQKDQTVDLSGGVHLRDSRGYSVRTEAARVDLARNTAAGDAAVHGEGPFGSLNAEGFRLIDGGRTIHFTGRSHAVLRPGPKGTP